MREDREVRELGEQSGHSANGWAVSLLEAALEATADGILIVDRRGRIVRFNRRFAELWRIPDAILVSGEDRQALDHVLTQLAEPEVFLRQVQELYVTPEAESHDTLRFTDGRAFERVSRPQRLGDEIVGRVWSFRDVTDRERAEADARRQAARTTTLGALTRVLMQSLEPAAVARELLAAAQKLVPGAAVRLRKYEADGETLHLVGSAGHSDAGVRTRTRLGDGLAGRAALERRMLICPDIATDPRYVNKKWAAAQGVSSCVAVPLLFGERLIGVMSIYTRERHEFAEEETDLLRLLADDAAVAMEHARVHQASVWRAQQLARLSELTKRLVGSLNIEQVGAEVLGAMQALIPGSVGRLWDLDEGETTMRLMACVGLRDAHGGTVRFRRGEGMAGIAATTHKPARSRDITQDPRFVNQAWAAEEGLRSAVILPLLHADRVHGILAVMRRVEQEFSDEEVAILESLAGHAAVALANARLHRETVRRGEQLESLLRSLKTVTSGLDLREILDRILAEAIRISGVPHVKVLLFDKTSKVLRVGAVRGSSVSPGAALPVGASLSGLVVQNGEPLFIADAQNDPRNLWRERDRELGIVTYLGLPINKGEDVLGVITFNTTSPYQYTPEEMILLASFADQAAIAIENARLFEASQRDLADRRQAEASLQRRTMQLEAVRTVGMELTRDLDLSRLLDRVIREAAGLIGAVSGAVWLWNHAEEHLEPGAFIGHDPAWFAAVRLRLGEGVTGMVAQRRVGLIVPDVHRSPLRSPAFQHRGTPEGVMAEPLLYQDRLLGTIALDRRASDPQFTAQDAEILALFAAQAAIAIENARLYEAAMAHAATQETRVAERTQALTTALREAEAAGRAKTDFLLNVSHELRTPLNAVLGFSQLLQRQVAAQLDTKQARYLDHIHESGKHLLDLINEILDLGKIEAGQMMLQCEMVDVAPLMDGAVMLVGELARRKDLVVYTEISPELPSVWVDPVRLKQILFNLLSNAVKFTPESGTVRLTAQRICDFQFPICDFPNQDSDSQSQIANQKSQLSDFLEIAVTDTGIGIRADDLPRLFQPFTQLEDPIRKRHEGTGLGLAITRRLVELHGGTITASSSGEGQGSTFTVRLPFGGPDGKTEEC
jgi:signal transduction histidine kinase